MRSALTIASLALLLAACGQGGEGNNAAAPDASGNAPAASAPAATGTLGSLLAADPRFTGLVRAAGMTRVLEGKEPYTVLAPTSQALDALPAGTLERLQAPAGKAELTALLRHHILPGTIMVADLTRAVEARKGKATLTTMTGEPLTVTRDGQSLRIAGSSGTGARLVGNEQTASNGVIHQIDAVLPAARQTGTTTD